jgi:hypothetical protein
LNPGPEPIPREVCAFTDPTPATHNAATIAACLAMFMTLLLVVIPDADCGIPLLFPGPGIPASRPRFPRNGSINVKTDRNRTRLRGYPASTPKAARIERGVANGSAQADHDLPAATDAE